MKQDFMRFLLTSNKNQEFILCNQENFILRENAYRLRKTFPGYHILINPAVKNNIDFGRPSGGCLLLFQKN